MRVVAVGCFFSGMALAADAQASISPSSGASDRVVQVTPYLWWEPNTIDLRAITQTLT